MNSPEARVCLAEALGRIKSAGIVMNEAALKQLAASGALGSVASIKGADYIRVRDLTAWIEQRQKELA